MGGHQRRIVTLRDGRIVTLRDAAQRPKKNGPGRIQGQEALSLSSR